MTTTKVDIKGKNREELVKELENLKDMYSKAVENLVMKKEKNLHRPREIRKNIARIKSALAQKE